MNPKLRVVIDTSVLVSAALRPHSVPYTAVTEVMLHHVSLISHKTYAEVENKLLHTKFDVYVSREERLRFLEMLFFAAETVPVNTVITDCRDPGDNKFLELAVDGQADCIVTGDNDLLVLNPFRRVAILTPRNFLHQRLGKF